MSKSKHNDPDRHFRTDDMKADLKGKSIRGGAMTMLGQGGKFVLRMGLTIILARLLTPEDYGLFGMVTVVVGFVALFKDLGLSLATVQKAHIDHRQVSTLLWINVAISGILMVMTMALAPAIAWFYKEPRLVELTIVLSIGFIFGGLSAQHQALLKRQMRFKALAAIEIGSMFLGTAAGIISAWYGAGYWSLAVLQLTGQVATAAGSWLLSGWIPGPPVRGAGVRPMLAVGSNYTGFVVLNYLSTNLDNLLIGSYLGAAPLGLYNRAYQILLLPLTQISMPIKQVAIPTLSHLQNDLPRYRAYYHKALLLMTSFGMPLVAFTFVTAYPLILVLLGENWVEVVPIFRVLSVAGFLNTFSMASGWVFISFGRTDRQFRWSILSSAVTTMSFMIGVRWGVLGVALGLSLSRLIIQPMEIAYCYQNLPLTVKELMSYLYRPFVASTGGAAALYAIEQLLRFPMDRGALLWVDLVLYCLLYLGIWVLLPNGRPILLEMIGLMKELRSKRKGPGSAASS
ncbi:lipopolysaccharide biosynthesis protein [Oscillatoria sp. HE19RPO]|uniref:lipopolysaccharide biosynthesis protein n=1 Tax=Oscillatoria sp. HE19RPO TaxID=2954806 RepID=UPI0020C3F6E7|nr:lipopolysaccharide biosynthesis protein [Oscillatoria sp. HE19RPO]